MDQVIDLTKKLIEIPSVSGNETAILKFVEKWLHENKFDYVVRDRLFTAGRIDGAPKGKVKKALILCGHIDTVAPGDKSAWVQAPWTAYTKDNRIFGLGSGDMKAGVAIQMITARQYRQRLKDVDVWVVAVADEEVSGAGSAAFVAYFMEHTDYHDVSCMIAEPTDENTIEVGHRGNRFIKLTFRGDAAHASQEGSYHSSAIPLAVNFLNNLTHIRNDIHSNYIDSAMGKPSLTPTRVGHGESYSINKAADITTISLDVRTTPALDDCFDKWIDSITKQYHCSWEYEAGYVLAALCDANAPILQIAKGCMGIEVNSISHGATDQAFFQGAGINTIVFGPGDFELAHTKNESVSIDRMNHVFDLYMQIISQI